ncbi:MAG: hypothetical protein ACYCYN_01145, partial [Solirubrobacteraceae bacterium]
EAGPAASAASRPVAATATLGLSGTQWLEAVLAAVALLLIAIGTRLLVRRSPAEREERLDDGLGAPGR